MSTELRDAMFTGPTATAVSYISCPPIYVPSKSSGYSRGLDIDVFRLKAPATVPGGKLTLTMRFAQWKLGGGAIAPITYEFNEGTEITVRPLPGFVSVDVRIDPATSGDSGSLVVTVDREIPTAFADPGNWTPIRAGVQKSIKSLTLGTYHRVDEYFSADVLNACQILRSDTGRFKTSLEWMEDEFEYGADANGDFLNFRGTTYRMQYVFPSRPGANTTNTGAFRDKPRSAIAASTSPTCYVLESGFLFGKETYPTALNLTANTIIMSSSPGSPAYLSRFVEVDTDKTWTGNTASETSIVGTTPVSNPNLVAYTPLYQYEDPDSATTPKYRSEPRPRVIPFVQTGTAHGRTIKKTGTDLVYQPEGTEGPPTIAFVASGDSPAPNISMAGSFTTEGDPIETTLFMRDIEVWGGSPPFRSSPDDDRIMRSGFYDCAFRFGTGVVVLVNGVETALYESNIDLQGSQRADFVRCQVTEYLTDGLDGRGTLYDKNGTILHLYPEIIEDRCAMQYGGAALPDTRKNNQCSTMHGGARALRIGSIYGVTFGPTIQDVRTSDVPYDCYSLIAGCYTSFPCPSTFSERYCFIGAGSIVEDQSVTWMLGHSFGNPYGSWSNTLGLGARLLRKSSLSFDLAWAVVGSSPTAIVYKDATATASRFTQTSMSSMRDFP